eukprot:CAMPEP_0172418350 /NCGR_PEP_ID=MMETSP1064-20121228/4861_1 /TAXON_ID=202472 /ORGANISM="Aulacoseira subarctica , Strain CCAP 1002/5" /LENGTH=193 /DNA_ID=CAMNT_0013157257 /DNA_START=11 /DNA_END=592 /DNA_ORIENTATION=-
MQEGKNFTSLTTELISTLDEMGFVWETEPAPTTESVAATGRRTPDNEGSASSTANRSNIGHSDVFASALASMRTATNRAAAAATENQEASTTRRQGNLWQQSPTIFNIPQQPQQRIGLHSHSYITHPYALNGYADHNRMPITAVYAPTIYMAPSGLPHPSFVASPIQSNNNNMAAQFFTPGPNFFLPPRRRFY